MFTVYPTKMKSMINMHKNFETEEQAKAYVASRNNPANYTIVSEGVKIDHTETKSEKVEKTATKSKSVTSGQKTSSKSSEKSSWKDSVDFTGAVRITRENVKAFYKKEGYIRVTAPNGKVLHTGRTKNMGKVFSNYVNCARYNQSYDFNIDNGDILLFKESEI